MHELVEDYFIIITGADSISPGITFLQTSISQDVLFRQTTEGKNKSGEIE